MTMAAGAGGGAQSPVDADDIFGVAGLLSLGGGLTQRLCATVAAAWVQHIEADDEPTRARHAELHAALYGRVACAVQAWLDDPNATVDLVMSNGARSVTRSDDGYQVTLPFSWILEVWARGVSLFAGDLCLGAVGDRDRLELQLVDLDLGRRAVVVSTV